VRTYGQYCSVAKALDVVGDRWTLLIVRELLLRGPCRYTDLRDSLPGIATNLLGDRLRQLERAGITEGEEAPPPVATTLYRLTPRGERLQSVIDELGRWGAPLMFGEAEGEEFRGHWLSLPARLFLTDGAPKEPPVTIELRVEDERIVLETVDGVVRARPGSAEEPDAAISGTPPLILGLLVGRLDLAGAQARGLQYEGDPEVLERVQPEAGWQAGASVGV
jgi:DNA-binding HxlR family transcriptional regulator